jgi:C4-dicarboxylate-specific signal transduction histidine kinase
MLFHIFSHEVRNLAGAALVLHRNLSRVPALSENEDFVALGTLMHGLDKLSAMELASSPGDERQLIDLGSVLDELRVLLESMCRKEGIELEWAVPDVTRSVWADQYGLIQVFLNLAKNSRRALENAPVKRIRITTVQENHSLVIRFEDAGPGISNPETLFRAFQRDAKATGLGLYVSRALMKSFGGDLSFEPREQGCCFAVTLQTPMREGNVAITKYSFGSKRT